jgi:hypothetical protein
MRRRRRKPADLGGRDQWWSDDVEGLAGLSRITSVRIRDDCVRVPRSPCGNVSGPPDVASASARRGSSTSRGSSRARRQSRSAACSSVRVRRRPRAATPMPGPRRGRWRRKRAPVARRRRIGTRRAPHAMQTARAAARSGVPRRPRARRPPGARATADPDPRRPTRRTVHRGREQPGVSIQIHRG